MHKRVVPLVQDDVRQEETHKEFVQRKMMAKLPFQSPGFKPFKNIWDDAEYEISDISDYGSEGDVTDVLEETEVDLDETQVIPEWKVDASDEDDDLVMLDTNLPEFKRDTITQVIDELSTGVKRKFTELTEVEEPKGRGPKVMRWCITYNNPKEEMDELGSKLSGDSNIKGFVFQKEIGKNGTPHFQMYIEFNKQIYASGVKASIGNKTVHVEPAKGSKKHNIKYCTKIDSRESEGFMKFGSCCDDFKSGQGKRTDLDDFANDVLVNSGITEDMIEEHQGLCLKYSKHAKELVATRDLLKAKRENLDHWREQLRRKKAGEEWQGQQQRELILFFGPTAVGKTTQAIMECVDKYDEVPYCKSGDNKWWDGYNNEKAVLIDEWRNGFVSIERFNEISNKGPIQVEVKGAQAVLLCDTMYFTSNKHPMHIMKLGWRDARYRAMVRRFSEVRWWNDANELKTLKNPGQQADSEEWETANEAWVHFWKMGDRPIEEGDECVPGTTEYFTF